MTGSTGERECERGAGTGPCLRELHEWWEQKPRPGRRFWPRDSPQTQRC